MSLGREIPQSPVPLPLAQRWLLELSCLDPWGQVPLRSGLQSLMGHRPHLLSCRTICSGQECSQSSWRIGSCSISSCAGQELQVGVQGNLQFLLAGWPCVFDSAPFPVCVNVCGCLSLPPLPSESVYCPPSPGLSSQPPACWLSHTVYYPRLLLPFAGPVSPISPSCPSRVLCLGLESTLSAFLSL